MDSAACLDADPELFFPETRGAGLRHGRPAQPALAVCAGCPVRAECDGYAESLGKPDGIWGGRRRR
jgi:WhiB family redox-sensing transcriptional regulator